MFEEIKMSHSIWLAIGFVFVMEGIGPLLSPNSWRKMMMQLSAQHDNQLRRIGGCLVITGIVIAYFYWR